MRNLIQYKHFLYLLFVLGTNTGLAQICEMPAYMFSQSENISPCNVKLNYSVYPNYSMTPIKTIRISYVVFQKSDGSGSFIGSDEQIINYFKTMIDSVNFRFSNIGKLNPEVSSPIIGDSKIRFKLNKVYIFKDDNLYYATLPRSKDIRLIVDSIYQIKILQNPNISNIDKIETLHIFMFPKGSNGIWGGQAQEIPCTTWIVMRAYDYGYNCNIWKDGTFNDAIHEQVNHMIHEIGHSLGLYHNFQGGPHGTQCDDCADNSCPIEATSNNYMDYMLTGQCAFSECQIAKIHYCLMGKMGVNMSNYIKEYCFFHDNQIISISPNQNIIWNSSKNLLGNLEILGNLNVECNISIPQGGKAIIKTGGKLIVNQGTFDNKCDQNWQGIEVQKGGYLELSNTSISDYSITVLNGGTLKIKDNVTIAGNNRIDIMSGAYVCIENNATINLQDILSVLNLHNGYIFGLSPAIGNSTNCINNIASINKTGNGSINLYTTNVYIQNQTYNNNTYISGNNISAGNNVTTTRPQGPVVIQNGANVVFDADGTLLLDKGFEVQLGAYFEAR